MGNGRGRVTPLLKRSIRRDPRALDRLGPELGFLLDHRVQRVWRQVTQLDACCRGAGLGLGFVFFRRRRPVNN